MTILRLFLFCSCWVFSALTSEDWKKLNNGEILSYPELPISREESAYGGTFCILIEAPLQEIEKAIPEWSKYPEIFSRIREVKLLKEEPDVSVAWFKVDAIFFTLRFSTRYHIDSQNHRMDWELDPESENDLRINTGYLQLLPGEEPDSSLMFYAVASDTKGFFPLPRFLKSYFMKRETRKAMREFKEYVETSLADVTDNKD